jgi:5-methylcytosine-specific restriction endonuclease McrA
VTRVPHSCQCGAVHPFGARCPMSVARQARRRGSTTERMGPGWGSISRRVIERDRGECQLRRPGCTGTATETDHIIPRSTALSWGWTRAEVNAMPNLQAACSTCNLRKAAGR